MKTKTKNVEFFNSEIDEARRSMKVLIQYVRDNKKRPIAVLVGTKGDGKVSIGWSQCRKKDLFKKSVGRNLAFIRSLKWFSLQDRLVDGAKDKSTVPYEIYKSIDAFSIRCKKYFNLEKCEVFGYNKIF